MPIPEYVASLRARVGADLLWLPGVTAVVRREDRILMVERADNGRWAPVTGIVDPLESPATCAAREVLEETGVVARVDRLAAVSVVPEVRYANGDRAAYVDHAFACTWLAGEGHVADDESTDVRWWPVDALPDLSPGMRARVDAALADEAAARF